MDPSLVRIIGSTGKEGKGENQFAQPRGICIDSATKEVFVVDCNNHRVQVYHLSSLAYIRQIGKGVQGDAPGALNYAVGVCMDDANQIYVADTNNHRISVFNRITGGHVRHISSQGTAPGFLFSPYGVCVDTYEGVLYVADYDNHRVQAFNKNSGEFIRVIGLGYGSGDGQLNQPIVICIDYEFDHLLVADYSNNRIAVFSKESGQFLRSIGTNAGPNNLSGPRGLCISKEANILFVADRENHRIQLYDKATYAFLRTVGNGMGSNPGQFIRPMEICVDTGEGVLLVVDGYNHRVQILELPELQAEKRRLKAVAQRKAEAELRGKSLPKPSLLAVSTQLTGWERVYVETRAGGVWLRFEHLGSLYDMHLSESEVPLLLTYAASLCGHGEIDRSDSADVEKSITLPLLQLTDPEPSAPLKGGETSMAQHQAELFLSVLEGLCSNNSTSSVAEEGEKVAKINSADAHLVNTAYLLVTPALFALHSLLERGWTPSSVSAPVITLLAGFLSNINCGIVAEQERAVVLEAIVRVLRAAVTASTNSLNAVLHAVLQSLSTPAKYHLNHAERDNTVGGAPKNHVSILMAHFELLGHVFAHNNAKRASQESSLASNKRISFPREATSPLMERSHTSHTPSAPPTAASCTHERRRQSAQQRADILQFVFGAHFMRALSEAQASKSQSLSAESAHTAVVSPAPALRPLDALGNFVPHDQDALAQGLHPAFVADPRVSLRSPTRASSSQNTPVKPVKVVNEIAVPPELATLVDTVFRLQQHRKSQSFVSLSDFCLQRMNTKAHHVSSPDDSTYAHALTPAEVTALQLKLFQCATNHLHSLRNGGEDAHFARPNHDLYCNDRFTARHSRGGRNIWRPQEPLAVGDLVDAQDKERCWFESIVQEIFVDGSVKVHFMGWGSKWDDILTTAELASRIAPLNSKTKNWRADLFKGGLIEIKCNDDLVNQKWMWGRITALNVEEAWVEVSYLFSNEPTVVKRAWLFGETICPVGMHTKEKSKMAAALVVKPLKKMEDIIKEKAERGDIGDEIMFFDRSDDVEEPLDWDSTEEAQGSAVSSIDAAHAQRDEEMASFVAESGSGRSTPFTRLRSHSTVNNGNANNSTSPPVGDISFLIKTVPADAMQHVSRVGLHIMDCLMSELLIATLEAGSESLPVKHSVDNASAAASPAPSQPVFEAALQLLRLIASTPSRRLLVPYFTRVATFHSGMRAKLMCGGLLSAQVTSVLHTGMQDVDSILHVLARFGEISARYCTVVRNVLNISLSDKALHEVSSRIEATVDRCGVTQIANDLIEFILTQENLRYELFAQFVGVNRFCERSAKLRKVLHRLFKAASRAESVKFQALFEGTLMRRELAMLAFLPQYTSHGEVDHAWAMRLMRSLCTMYESAQSVSRLELLHIPQCLLAAERALQREFAALPVEHVAGVAVALATALNCLLDPSYQPEMPPSQKIDALRSMLDLQKIVMSEELLHNFRLTYEVHLARRLLSGRYASIAAEKSVLEALPQLSRASKMLVDVTQDSHQADFTKYLMARIDNEEIEYTPLLGMVLQKQKMAVKVLCHATWARHLPHALLYSNMRLPAPMRTIQTHFDEFYQTTARITKGSCSRRLTWQHGVGQVILSCVHQRSGKRVDVKVNEAQAAVLWAFNEGSPRKTVSELCLAVNLSLEELRGVLRSLSEDGQLPLLSADRSGIIEPSTVITLSESFMSDSMNDEASRRHVGGNVVALDYTQSVERHVQRVDVGATTDWRSEQIDACVVRVLKTAIARRGAGRVGALSADELVAGVFEELSKRNQHRNVVHSEDDILCRANHLVGLNYIDKVNLSVLRGVTSPTEKEDLATMLGASVGYSYISDDDHLQDLAETTHGNSSTVATGEALFQSLVDLVDAVSVQTSPTESQRDLFPAEQHESGEGEGKGDDCDESKRSDTSTPSHAVTTNEPVVHPASPRDLLPLAERVLNADQLLCGIVHWTSSVRPCRAPSMPSAASAAEETPQKVNSHVALLTSRDIASTPPRPEERRLSNRFSNISASPLRFGDTSKRNSFSAGGSESKSGVETSPLHAKLSVRPPPPPTLGASGRRSFTSPPNGVAASAPLHTFAATATVQLSLIKERLYETLGETVSQLNKLIYQHHLGTLDPALRKEISHFPPPSIASFLTNLSSALTNDARDLNDWADLHRELFLTLPPGLIAVICRKYCSLLETPPEALSEAIVDTNGLWTRRFPLLSESGDSDAKDVSKEQDAEDSKQGWSSEPGTVSSENVPAVLKLSLYEYVFSTFACDHPRSLDSVSSDAHEKPALFGLSNSSSTQKASGSKYSVEMSGSGGSSNAKSDKKRTRHRSARPSTASPHQSRSGGAFAAGEDIRRSDLFNASMFADAKGFSPFGSIPFGTWNGAPSSEHNQGSSFQALQADTSSGRSSDGSNSSHSTRSNSISDFTVAQLMHSIESELRSNGERHIDNGGGNKRGAASFDSSHTYVSPPVFWDNILSNESDRKGKTSQSKQSSRSLLSPLQPGVLLKPDEPTSRMLPSFHFTETENELHFGVARKDNNISLTPRHSVESQADPVQGRMSDSLQDLLRAYCSAFYRHLVASFWEPHHEGVHPAEETLSLDAMTKIVCLLLQGVAHRVSEAVSLHDSSAQTSSQSLWFLAAQEISLMGIVEAAVAALARDNSIKELRLSSFDHRTACFDETPSFVDKKQFEDEMSRVLKDCTDTVSGSAAPQTQQCHFSQVVLATATSLNLPPAAVLPHLVRYQWDAGRMIDAYFGGTIQMTGAAESGSDRTFLRLSESFADQYSRGIHPRDSFDSRTVVATASCDKCHAASPCKELYALQCRHFACGACWSAHIQQSANLGAGHVACVHCSLSTQEPCTERTGVDLVSIVCDADTVTKFTRNKMKLYARDFHDSHELYTSEIHRQLSSLLRLSQGECLLTTKPSASILSNKTSEVPAIPTAGERMSGHASSPVPGTPGGLARMLPPALVRSPAAAATLHAQLRSGGGTPSRPATQAASPHTDREVPVLPRLFSGLSPFNTPRNTSASVGAGVAASSARSWAHENSNGNSSKFLVETRIFMRTRAAEIKTQQKHCQEEQNFRFLCNLLNIVAQYLRAVSVMECVETQLLSAVRGASKAWVYFMHEALEALRDLLTVTNIKIRSKWQTAEGLTDAATSEALSNLRLRMQRIVKHTESYCVLRKDRSGKVDACRTPFSVAVKVEDGSVLGLSPSRSAPWLPFYDPSGCEVLNAGLPSQAPPAHSELAKPSSKFSECQLVIQQLANHGTMTDSELLSHLDAVEGFLNTGYQTVLFANNICHILVSLCNQHAESVPVRHGVLSLMVKLTHQDHHCAATLVDLGVWGCWAGLLAQRRADPAVCLTCAALMRNLFATSEAQRRAAMDLFDVQQGFDLLIHVLHTHALDVHVCRAVHLAILQAADKTFTAESSFVQSGVCEVLIASLLQFFSYSGVKMQFVTLLERIASGNKFMQERLCGLEVFEHVIELISDHAANDASLLKQICIAVSALTSTYHAGQTKFATLGGCRALCHALRVCENLSALTHVLRTIATLALRNSYVQDYFQLENTVELLLTKKEEITALSTRSESFETKSQANLLLLSLEFALDTVRIPASHHNASHDLATIAFLAGTRRASGRLGRNTTNHNNTIHEPPSTAVGLLGTAIADQDDTFTPYRIHAFGEGIHLGRRVETTEEEETASDL